MRSTLRKYLLVNCFLLLASTINIAKAAPTSTITITGNNAVGAGGNGITATSLTYGKTGVVLYGFTATETGAANSMSAINFSTSGVLTDFFTNFKIYRCSNTNYTTGTLTQITTATIATAGSQLNITFPTAETFTGVPQSNNYFIVADYNKIANNLPTTVSVGIYHDMTISTGNKVDGGNTQGQTFSLASPVATISNYNTGIYTGSTFSAGTSYNMLGFSLSFSGPTNMHQLIVDISYLAPTNYTFTDYVTQNGGSVQLIDAATGNTPAAVSGININSNTIAINFNSTPLTTTVNYYLKVTFSPQSTWNTHQPGPFMMCVNAASNAASNFCQNFSGCSVVDNYNNATTGSACSQTFYPQTIVDWIGTSLSNGDDWNVAINWSPNKVPGPYDIAREGVQYGFNKLPIVYTQQNGSSTINVGSILFGSTTSGGFNTLGVTVNNGYTLNVNGDITFQSDAQAYRNYPVNLAGNGIIQAANLNVLTSNTANTFAISAVVNSSVNSLMLSGNIKLASDYSAAYNVAFNSTFKLTGGTANVTGVLQSTNTLHSLSTFAVIPPTGSTAILQLENVNALSGLSTTASSNTLSFNNAGGRIAYTGAAQTVYTDAFITGLTGTTGPIYYSIRFAGTGAKTPNGGKLQVYGDFINARGTALDLSTTPVLIEGTDPQSLKDNSANYTLFSTVSFSGASTKTISAGNFALASTGTLNITGTSSTVLDAGTGQLTLNSDANSSATVSTITGGPTIIGNVNVQRFVTGGSTTSRGYRIITSPVNISSSTSGSGFIDLSYLNTGTNSILTAGPNGTANGFSVTNPNPLIYLYDETRTSSYTTFVAGKNVGIAAISGATAIPALSLPAYSVIPISTTGANMAAVQVPVGNSFLLYYVGSTSSNNITSASRPLPDNATATAVGYLNQGTIPVKLWKTPTSTSLPYDVNGSAVAGLSQVGNPYASTISLDQLYSDNLLPTNNISSFFYELIPGGGYVYYNAASPHNVSDLRASKYIVSGQGFFVRTTIAGQKLTFYEGEKVAYPSNFSALNTTTPALLMDIPSKPSVTNTDMIAAALPTQATGTTNAALHVQITKDSVNYSQTGVYFNSTTSDKFNDTEDAVDIGPGSSAVYLSSYSSDGTRLGINQLGNYAPGKRIKLYAGATATGLYSISLADLVNVDTSLYNVFLVDNKMSDSLDMVHYKSYAFNITTADTTTYGANRFVLAIEPRYLPQYRLISFSGKKASNGVQLYWQTQNAGNNTAFVLQKLNTGNTYDPIYSIKSNSSPLYAYTDEHPIIGNNTYRLQQTDLKGTVTYSTPVTIYFNASIPDGSLTIYPNPAKSIINISLTTINSDPAGYIADIYDISGNVIVHKNVKGNYFTQDVSAYKLGVYVIELKTNSGNLLGKAKFVKIN